MSVITLAVVEQLRKTKIWKGLNRHEPGITAADQHSCFPIGWYCDLKLNLTHILLLFQVVAVSFRVYFTDVSFGAFTLTDFCVNVAATSRECLGTISHSKVKMFWTQHLLNEVGICM